jgi:hypothetical protein
MCAWLVALLAIGAGPVVEVKLLDGQSATGQLVALSAERATIEANGKRADFEIEKLWGIAAAQKPAAPQTAPSVWVELIDGSTLLGTRYSVAAGKARLALLAGPTIEIATREIANVRFQPASDALLAEWTRLLAQKADGDLLVIRKDETTIDYYTGVIGNVSEESVELDLRGKQIPVKRPRVFGISYYHAANRTLPPTICYFTAVDGSRWAVHEIGFSGDFRLSLPCGVNVRLPAAALVNLDYSGGKVVYLSDLKPEAVEWTPFFTTAKPLPSLTEFYAPRMDRGLASKTLRLDGKEYHKGIALYSRTEITFRLPDRFSRLKAIAGIDDEVRPRGNVRLMIRGDERVLFDETLTGKDPARLLDLDINGVRKLIILVDYGEEMDTGDYLNLCNARVSK